jgi:uncharacterized protein YjiS (DUF1127 family)
METTMTRSLTALLYGFSFRGVLVEALDRMLAWQERAQQADSLRGMDDRQLKDIGLSRSDIERILRQPRHL